MTESDVNIALKSIDALETRERLLEIESLIYGDRYDFVKDSYVQYLDYEINDVKYNVRKACLFRGPVLYCLEENDNGKYLNKFVIDADNSFDEVDDKSLNTSKLPSSTIISKHLLNK